MSQKVDTKMNRVELAVDEKVFPRAVSVAAAYRFLDRCYVRLERSGRGKLSIFLKGKRKLAKARLDDLAGEFDNELLHQLMRHQVAERTDTLREVLVGRALLSAEPVEGFALDGQNEQSMDTDLDYLDDPLGIAVPWEEKYGDADEKGQDDQENQTEKKDKGDQKKP